MASPDIQTSRQASRPATRQDCLALDEADPLAPRRQMFQLPPGVIYLDGNSLGALTHAAERRVQQTLRAEWGTDLIKSWNVHDWIELPARLGARIAPLVGAAPDETIVCDSTSVNIFKIAAAAARARGERHRIVTELGNFPTDPYMLQGLAALVPGLELVCVERDQLKDAIDERTFLVVLTHVHYATAEMFDLATLTAQVQAKGARILWDLSHSVGAVPVDLAAAGADFAVGCSYKYLNGGPGAPAFMYVRRSLQADLQPVLSGWLGHARPFDFIDEYVPAAGMTRHRCGTPPVLAFAALEGALSAFEGVDMQVIRRKSEALSELFIELVESFGADFGAVLASPRSAAQRGSHVSFAHPDGYALMQQLISRGIIGDFRAPNLLRFGFTPLYTSFADVWGAVDILARILDERQWDQPQFLAKKAVT